MKNKVWIFAVMLLGVLVASCGSSDPAPPCTLSGTLHNVNFNVNPPVLLTGSTFNFQLDTDEIYSNGNEAAKYNATWTGDNQTTSYSFDISSLPAGEYYIYVDIYPTGSMLYGWYTGTTSPVSPAYLKVPVTCGATYDIYIGIT